MYRDEFKARYKTLPLAISREYSEYRNRTIISHQHKEMELISVSVGTVDFYIETTKYKATAGDIVLVPPYAIHRIQYSADCVVSYNCICFDLDLIWDKDIKRGLESGTLFINNHLKADKEYAKKMQEWINSSCDAYEVGHPGWELKTIGCLSMLIGCLKEQGLLTTDIKNKKDTGFAQKAMCYISDNYTMQISSTDAAGSLYMSNSYFCRAFKKAFGCRFSEYLLAYRLEKARMFLCNTTDSITDISFRTGFNNCSYFSKMYKAYFGTSPLTYRKEELHRLQQFKN